MIPASWRTLLHAFPLDVCIVDGNGDQVTSFGGTGGTSSSFGAAFPAFGTAAGFKDAGGNMAPGNLDGAGLLKVNVVVGGGGGGGGAVTIADGADVAEGATTDAKVLGDVNGTVSAKLRGLSTIFNDVWVSASHWLQVSIQNATLAVTQSGAWTVTADAGANLNTSALALEAGGHLAAIDTNAGAQADAAVVGDVNGSLSAKLRGLSKILNDVWDSVNHRFNVAVMNSVGVSQAVSPWVDNITQFGGQPVQINIGGSGNGVPRVTVAYDGAVTLQASQTSGVTNATTTRNTTTGVGPYNAFSGTINITNGGAATGNLQLFLEDSDDGGTTWDDVVASPVFAFGAGVTTYKFAVTGFLASSRPQLQAAQQETLAAGSVRQGPFGDRIRVREKVSGVAGSPSGVVYTISAVFET